MAERLGWLEEMVGTVRCASCGAAYGRGDLQIVGRREQHWFVRCDCGTCGSQGIAVVTVEHVGRHVSTGGHRPPALTVDDVLDAHELLERWSGNAESLFDRQR